MNFLTLWNYFSPWLCFIFTPRKLEENKEAPNEKEKTGDSDNEEGKVNPADGKVNPADRKVNPADGKVNPADGKVNPAEPVKKKSYLPVKRFVWDHEIRYSRSTTVLLSG